MFYDNMPDYSKSIIYTIRTRDSLYVGSTTNFINRKYHHNCCIYQKKNRKLYETINKNNGEWDMKPYKEFPCENKLQLNIEEERIRCELKADLNMNSCIFSLEKHKIRQKKKQENLKIKYRTDAEAKMKKREADKKYREENKDKIKENYNNNKEARLKCSKKWKDANKDRQAEYQREYRKKIKDKNKD